MKITFQKKIVLFKLKNYNTNIYKTLFLFNKDKTNCVFFVFGLYFKIFFDMGMNFFGTIPYWFSKIVGFVYMREFSFYKVTSTNIKFSRLFNNFSLFLNDIITRSKQGYFLEFKIVGYFRAKRTCLSIKKSSLDFNKSCKKFIIMYLGYSHLIFLTTNNSIMFVRGKKRFMFFTPYKQEFTKIVKQIFFYKPFNVYKIKGIRTFLNLKKMKPGKQKQQKKSVKK